MRWSNAKIHHERPGTRTSISWSRFFTIKIQLHQLEQFKSDGETRKYFMPGPILEPVSRDLDSGAVTLQVRCVSFEDESSSLQQWTFAPNGSCLRLACYQWFAFRDCNVLTYSWGIGIITDIDIYLYHTVYSVDADLSFVDKNSHLSITECSVLLFLHFFLLIFV